MGEKTLLTVQNLLDATNGYLFKNDPSVLALGFETVATDSRNVGSHSLFVPLIGENQDGHKYVAVSCANGARIVLVQKSSLSEYEGVYHTAVENGVVIIVVENTLTALQSAAKYYVSLFPNLKKIAVTGSNGKTTVKECLGAVLSQKYTVVMNVGNLNSETGLPLSVFSIRKEHEIGLFEMGMNRRGEIKELADIFFPDLAIITNIGTAHIGILGTQQAIAEEKKQIFANFNSDCVGFICEDDSFATYLKEGVIGTVYTYGEKSTNGIQHIENNGIAGSTISYNNTVINFPLIGKHNAINACAAIALGAFCDVSAEEIKVGLESVKPLFGRSQILEGKPTFIQDCYNGSFESMSVSLDFFLQMDWAGKKVAILGDMLELGEKSLEIHTNIVQRVVSSNLDCIVFIGVCFSQAYERLNVSTTKNILLSEKIDDNSITQVCNKLAPIIDVSDIVLCKGSRGIRLERVIATLQTIFQKGEV